eukprot:4606002-Prymnesium_polylepis.1
MGYSGFRTRGCLCVNHPSVAPPLCPTSPSCHPGLIESGTFVLSSDNSGLLRWPPQAPFRQPQNYSEPRAVFASPAIEGSLFFNSSNKIGLADAVHCVCHRSAESSKTELVQTHNLPFGFRRCIQSQPLSSRNGHDPWQDCGRVVVPPPSPPGRGCMMSCFYNTRPWGLKCAQPTCAGCDQCPSLGLPTAAVDEDDEDDEER